MLARLPSSPTLWATLLQLQRRALAPQACHWLDGHCSSSTAMLSETYMLQDRSPGQSEDDSCRQVHSTRDCATSGRDVRELSCLRLGNRARRQIAVQGSQGWGALVWALWAVQLRLQALQALLLPLLLLRRWLPGGMRLLRRGAAKRIPLQTCWDDRDA